MAKAHDKRKKIFDKYVTQLQILNKNNFLSETIEYELDHYLCPICLRKFSVEDLESGSRNMLTLEDAPPKSLGGHARTLTCKECNSKCGHEIDFHLTERLIELDGRAFLPNVETKVQLIHKGKKVQGIVKVDKSGIITVVHSEKNNNPGNLHDYINNTKGNDVIDIRFKLSRVEKLRFEVALLKTGYILCFEKYGYALILNKAFDIVREQLLNPKEEIYPEGFWTKQPSFQQQHEGVHCIKTKGYEGFFAIFLLSTKASENRFGVYLPISEALTLEVVERLKKMNGGFELSLESNASNDYFEDAESIKMLKKHIIESEIQNNGG